MHEGRPYILCLFCLKCRGDPRGRPLEQSHAPPLSTGALTFQGVHRYTLSSKQYIP